MYGKCGGGSGAYAILALCGECGAFSGGRPTKNGPVNDAPNNEIVEDTFLLCLLRGVERRSIPTLGGRSCNRRDRLANDRITIMVLTLCQRF